MFLSYSQFRIHLTSLFQWIDMMAPYSAKSVVVHFRLFDHLHTHCHPHGEPRRGRHDIFTARFGWSFNHRYNARHALETGGALRRGLATWIPYCNYDGGGHSSLDDLKP
jgi:hypothetical protein